MLHITPSERAALQLLAAGSATHAIADRLGIGENEVDAHLAALFSRLGAASRTEAIEAAFRRGLLTVDEQIDKATPVSLSFLL